MVSAKWAIIKLSSDCVDWTWSISARADAATGGGGDKNNKQTNTNGWTMFAHVCMCVQKERERCMLMCQAYDVQSNCLSTNLSQFVGIMNWLLSSGLDWREWTEHEILWEHDGATEVEELLYLLRTLWNRFCFNIMINLMVKLLIQQCLQLRYHLNPWEHLPELLKLARNYHQCKFADPLLRW